MGCLLIHICALAGILKFLFANMIMASERMHLLVNGRFSTLYKCTNT